MKDTIYKALQEMQAIFGDSVFTNQAKFKSGLLDILPGSQNEPIRNLLNNTIGGANAFARLQKVSSADISIEIVNLTKEMSRNFYISEDVTGLVIECIVELLRSSMPNRRKTMEQAIVIDIGGSGVRTGIAYANGLKDISYESVNSVNELIQLIKQCAPAVTGIALSVPGFIQGDSGYVILSRNAPYLEGGLKEKIESAFPGASVHIVNDGEAHALALLKYTDVELGAINLSLGTAVGFGVLNENGQVVRALDGNNWDIGDMWIDRSAFFLDSYAWNVFGNNGLEILIREYGDEGYERYGNYLGRFITQLAVVFNPKTIGLSGGIIVHNWNRIEEAVNGEFRPPYYSSVRLYAQNDPEAALTGLTTFFEYN